MKGWSVARLAEIPVQEDGRCPWRPIRHHLGIKAFGINAWEARAAGDRLINEHDEEGEAEELYLVFSGHATFKVDGDEIDAPEGTLVFVQPAATRTAFAQEAGTTLLAIGAKPGEPYHVTGWEVGAPLNRLYEAGDYAGAADAATELVEQYPDYTGLLYNLACCESLAGRRDDALEHLRRAIESDERYRDYARDDADFEPIRNDPDFARLVQLRST
jgi:tetratricopeptide (TPR) repeat protein